MSNDAVVLKALNITRDNLYDFIRGEDEASLALVEALWQLTEAMVVLGHTFEDRVGTLIENWHGYEYVFICDKLYNIVVFDLDEQIEVSLTSQANLEHFLNTGVNLDEVYNDEYD